MLAVADLHADASAVHDGAVRGVDEEFLALMCADDDFLRAEFEAIIAQEWADSLPPADPPVASPSSGPVPHGHGLPRGCHSSPCRPSHPGDDGWRRQRSPPRPVRAPDRRSTGWMDESR